MRAATAWLMAATVVVASCGGSSGDDDGTPGDAPTVAISDVTVGEGGAALLEYAFRDDGPVRVEIDWGDGSPIQGFTGASGSFTSRHVYDSPATSVVVTVITTDADGNTSAATRTVDLTESPTTIGSTAASTVPATSAAPSTVAESTSTTSTTTTTTAPPPPPPPEPDPTSTTTSTTTTTTTTPPRNYAVTVRGDSVEVLGDCEGFAGGDGDFVIVGVFDTDRSAPASFTIGRESNPEQIGEGEARIISSTITRTGEVVENDLVEWVASFTVTEYDAAGFVRTPDPNMNARTASSDGLISTARSPFSRTLSVGAGSCRVDMTFVVTAEFVD